MNDTVIQVENLSKRYIIGHQRGKDDGLRHALEAAFRSPVQWLRNKRRRAHSGTREEFWALKDVSFDVKQGEVVGIIGRNGAGKSTLLKILSRITEPTSGRISLDGRVASLLEVGTGFHQELTGRENIFLNGAILGMTKVEIKQKFDEIVAFSEVEKFLDTPVKRYSSGMYVRLAFAVAAHLEPEILVVDEVLAVGDAEFQKKCLGKMQDVATGGRTILFVSHNMAAVSKLCDRSILLDAGRVRLVGPTEEVLPHYLRVGTQSDGIRTWSDSNSGALKIHALRVLAPDGTPTGHVDIRYPFTIEVDYTISETVPMFRIGLQLSTSDGTIAFTTSNSADPKYETKPWHPGKYTTSCVIPGNLLNEGYYSIRLSADVPFQKVFFTEEGVLGFSVEQTCDIYTRFPEKWPGVVCPQFEWQTMSSNKSDSQLLQKS